MASQLDIYVKAKKKIWAKLKILWPWLASNIDRTVFAELNAP
jgi:hypothetical protein